MQKEVERDQAPREVDRVDKGRGPNEQDHIHLKDGSAQNKDGSPKHGDPSPSNKLVEWLKKHGWM
jgi:hypothetical protein